MTKSEKICNELGKLYFYKELVKSDLVYIINEKNEEKELADVILRVGNYILPIQIKEMQDTSKDINKWLDKKVYKNAKNQTKETCKNILTDIKFKNETNSDILEDIQECEIIPIIIFDVSNIELEYKKIYITSDNMLLIHIFNLLDFQKMCNKLISSMEMIRYIKNRVGYVNKSLLIFQRNSEITIIKNKHESDMLLYYTKFYNLDLNDKNTEKLVKFNTYLTLFEKHCSNKKENYKVMIKILSQFYIKKIYYFIDRLDYIIKKGFRKELYWNSYIVDDEQCVLFISLTKEKYKVEFINFISNMFMKKFNIKNVLVVITYAISEENYELDFAIVEYDSCYENSVLQIAENEFGDFWTSQLQENY